MTDLTSLNRRQLLALGVGAAAGGAGVGLLRWPTGALGAEPLSGTPFPLVSLEGKAPLGQVYDHPPNYETPTTRLIGERNPPFTDAEDYYVRYRESDIYRVDPDGLPAADRRRGASRRARPVPRRSEVARGERVGTVGACCRPRSRAGAPARSRHAVDQGRRLVRRSGRACRWPRSAARGGRARRASVVAFRGGRTIATTKRDYWRHWDLEPMLRRGPLLAYALNGEPLPLLNGYPLRLVVPGTYAPGWVKQVVEVDIRRTPHPGDWRGKKPGLPAAEDDVADRRPSRRHARPRGERRSRCGASPGTAGRGSRASRSAPTTVAPGARRSSGVRTGGTCGASSRRRCEYVAAGRCGSSVAPRRPMARRSRWTSRER